MRSGTDSAPKSASELKIRFVLGPAMLAVVGGIYWLDSARTGGMVSAAVLGLLAVGGVLEYAGLLRNGGYAVAKRSLVVMTTLLAASVFWLGSARSGDHVWLPLVGGTLALLFAVAAGSLAEDRMKDGLEQQGATLLGFVWVAWPMYLAAALALRHLPSVLYVLLICKGGDIGAYLLGRAFGRRKLIPHVSPGKTVVGAVGSVVVSGILAVALRPSLTPPEAGLELTAALAVGMMLNACAQIGDLVESLLKRRCGAKDSSRLLPAHGGILDLVDSLLFAYPAYFLILVSLT